MSPRPDLVLAPDRVAALTDRVRAKIRSVPDFPKPGILFRDITPVLADPACLTDALSLHLSVYADKADQIDKVVGIESRGFLFGMAIAGRLGVGFAPVRKPGKLPAQTIEQTYSLEYGEDTVQIHADALQKGERILVVDDLLATGGTARASCDLIERLGGTVMGTLFLIELEGLRGRGRLQGLRVESLLTF